MLGKEILFVCVENAGRSQMAKAFSVKYGLKADCAGTFPSGRVNPLVIDGMKEKGIDLSSNFPKRLTWEMISRANLVVNFGCSVADVCPRTMLAQMQKKIINWDVKDPKSKSLFEVRAIRDEIEKRVIELSNQ